MLFLTTIVGDFEQNCSALQFGSYYKLSKFIYFICYVLDKQVGSILLVNMIDMSCIAKHFMYIRSCCLLWMLSVLQTYSLCHVHNVFCVK